MTERDPLDRLSRVANQPEQPSVEFRERLLAELLGDLTADQPSWSGLPGDRDANESTENEPTENEPTEKVIMLSPEANKRSKRPRTGLLVAASVAAVALIGGLVVVANRDDGAPPADLPEPTVPSTDPVEETDPALIGDEVPGAPEGVEGFGVTRFNAVPPGDIADIGEGYRLQVLSVTEDATDEVLTRFEFIDPPPAGSRYALVSLAGGYYGLDDPQENFLAFIRAVDFDTGEEFDIFEVCGAFPQFPPLGNATAGVNIFGGSVQRGELCVVVPEDNEGVVIQAFGGSGDDGLFLMAVPDESAVVEIPALTGVQPGATSEDARQNPKAIGTPAEAGDTGWSVTVTGPAVDITDAVLAEDPSNAGPPDGFRFVGVPMSMEHGGTTDEAPFVVNARAVGDSNLQYGSTCGVVPDQLDVFSPVPPETAVEGQLCFVVPADEIGSMTVYPGRTFADVFFATQLVE